MSLLPNAIKFAVVILAVATAAFANTPRAHTLTHAEQDALVGGPSVKPCGTCYKLEGTGGGASPCGQDATVPKKCSKINPKCKSKAGQDDKVCFASTKDTECKGIGCNAAPLYICGGTN
jgi:hypothetical protein